jgi:hypothetical protein
MSLLDQVSHGKTQKVPVILIYGTAGIGKSSFAADAPKPIFIRTEDRQGHLQVSKFPLIKTYEDVVNQLKTLIQEEHPYKTLVIDSLDWLERGAVHSQVVEDHLGEHANGNKIETVAEIGYGQGYAKAAYYAKEIVKGLSVLREKKNMGVILIAHALVKQMTPPDGDAYQKYTLDMHEKFAAPFIQFADAILFAQYKTVFANQKKKFDKDAKRAVSTGARILHTEDRGAWLAKNSYDFPAELEMQKDAPFKCFLDAYEQWQNKPIK